MARHDHQATTTQRGLGWAHQRLRARLLPTAWYTLCPLGCGKLMLPGQDLDLDHPLPRALGGRAGQGRMAHRHCNRSKGSTFGHALRASRKQGSRIRTKSRRW
jgi:hypothetical protein